jgi:hypothetical protein
VLNALVKLPDDKLSEKRLDAIPLLTLRLLLLE